MDTMSHVEKPFMRDEGMPRFRAGDTVRVLVKIVEMVDGEFKERTRPQAFEGVVIRRRRAGISSTFTVRKLSYGIGVERIGLDLCPVEQAVLVVIQAVLAAGLR